MVGIDLVEDCQTGRRFPTQLRIGHQVVLACRRRGVIVRNIGDTLILMPAPAMPVELVEELCSVLLESVYEVLSSQSL